MKYCLMLLQYVVLLNLMFFFARSLNAQQDANKYLEEYALASDREALLGQLTPGSQPYYFFHTLHYQTTGQIEKAREVLDEWGRKDDFAEYDDHRTMLIRQALLEYRSTPEESLKVFEKYLRIDALRENNIPQNTRPVSPAANPSLLDVNELLKKEIKEIRLSGIEASSLLEVLPNLDFQTHVDEWLSMVDRVDIPKLPELVANQLKRLGTPFGKTKIHHQMTLEQLNKLKELHPKVLQQDDFVRCYLKRLQPVSDSDVRDRESQRSYLQRLEDLVSALPSSYADLRACILFHRLELDQKDGIYDRERFVRYLEIPKKTPYIRQSDELGGAEEEQKSGLMSLAYNPASYVPQLTPIRDDVELVNDYLLYFLRAEENADAFRKWIEDEYLDKTFAESKILNGIGDSKRFYQMLSSKAQADIKHRSELRFSPQNESFFGAEQNVRVYMLLKNIDRLEIRIYRLDAANVIRDMGSISSDIELEGIKPSFQRSISYQEPSDRRHQVKIELPELQGRGIWVVDFLGGGLQARALIQKGELRTFTQKDAGGRLIRVVNEKGEVEKESYVEVKKQRYYPDIDGLIRVPRIADPTVDRMLIATQYLAIAEQVDFTSSEPELFADFVLDTESLLAGKEANLLLRPSLFCGGRKCPLERVRNPKLNITLGDMSGVKEEHVERVTLSEIDAVSYRFKVPDRLSMICFELVGEYDGPFGKFPVSAKREVLVNPWVDTARFASFFLQPSNQGFTLLVLGRNGEVYADQKVNLRFKLRGLANPIVYDAITDAAGCIELGEIPRVESILAKTDLVGEQKIVVTPVESYWPSSICEVVGKSILLPAAKVENGRYSLVELRANVPYANWTSNIREKPGAILLEGLGKGEYLLRDHFRGKQSSVRIIEADDCGDWWQSPTQIIEKQDYAPSYVESVEQRDGKVFVNLQNCDEKTRVHVIGRVFHRFNSDGVLMPTRSQGPSVQSLAAPASIYVSNRKLGEEQQYVMNRAQRNYVPGNMLPLPSWLLNPWENEESESYLRDMSDGDELPARKLSPEDPKAATNYEDFDRTQNGVLASGKCPFLTENSWCQSNLRANENGTFVLDAAVLARKSHLQFVVTHPTGVTYHSVYLDKVNIVPLIGNDQRLVTPFPEAEHRSEKKAIELLKGGEWNQIGADENARFRVISDVEDLYSFYNKTCRGRKVDWELFRPIVHWQEYSFEERCRLYERLACHELDLFIFQKDRDFFECVVLPHLRNKLEKRFIDQWLVGDDLSKFLEPWRLAQLNPVELVLLKRNIPTAQGQIEQRMRAKLDDEKGFRNLRRNLFAIALAGRGEEFEGNLAMVLGDGEIWDELGREYSIWSPSVDEFEQHSLGGMGGMGRGMGRGMGGMGGGFESYTIDPSTKPWQILSDSSSMDEFNDEFAHTDEAHEESAPGSDRSVIRERLMESLEKDTYKRMENFNPSAKWRYSQPYLWKEAYYYRPTWGSKIRFSPFWFDWFQHSGESSFLSKNFDWGPSDFSTALMAVAVMDLPWDNKYEWKTEEGKVLIRPERDCVAFVQRNEIVNDSSEKIPIGLAQQIFLYRENDYQKAEDLESDDEWDIDAETEEESGLLSDCDGEQLVQAKEFLKGVPYQSRVVVMNPTDSEVQVDVLAQIPQGAIPLNGSEKTRSWFMVVPPFDNLQVNFEFYFPEEGEFSQYGVQVSDAEGVLASLPSKKFHVTPHRVSGQPMDRQQLFRHGSDEQVLQFLKETNLAAVNPKEFQPRLVKRDFFDAVVQIYSDRQLFKASVWEFAFLHRNDNRMAEWFQHNSRLCSELGPMLKSDLLNVDPIENQMVEHHEFFPLIPMRRFAVGQSNDIPNAAARVAYNKLLSLLCYKDKIDPLDKLQLVSFLLLQNRIEEAQVWFSEVSRDSVAVKLQYDYCDAYLSMYRRDYARARTIATEYKAYPLPRWRVLFAEVIAQLEDRDNLIAGRKSERTLNADESLELVKEGSELYLYHNHIGSVTVQYFEMDVEALFSRKPFGQHTGKSLAWTVPKDSNQIDLESAKEPLRIELPKSLQNTNVLVQVTSRQKVISHMVYSNQLKVVSDKESGILQVLHRETREPLDATYIKVFGRDAFGKVEFYKDGFTDLRGEFDYLRQTTAGLSGLTEFAILIVHPKYGTRVIEL